MPAYEAPSLSTLTLNDDFLVSSSRITPDAKRHLAIIGAGWYGAHLALAIRRRFPAQWEVTIFERNERIFDGVSGKFGIRLHCGPHYPRSPATRESCHDTFDAFRRQYTELVTPHRHSVYALGARDADGEPSKVGVAEFARVCEEFGYAGQIGGEAAAYTDEVLYAADLDEPSVVVGEKLREYFGRELAKAGVEVVTSFEVTRTGRQRDAGIDGGNRGNDDDDKPAMLIEGRSKGAEQLRRFDRVVNATGYQSLLAHNPHRELPLGISVVYQPCLALVYECLQRPLPSQPFSFIVMDGWYPCLMPYDDASGHAPPSRYIMTHGKWTILGSHSSAEAAHRQLAAIGDAFIESEVRPRCEHEMARFWPAFGAQFAYAGQWVGSVLAKLRSTTEFRSAVTFEDQRSGVIHITPGKISNVFDAEREVLALIGASPSSAAAVINEDRERGYRYVRDGVLSAASGEIAAESVKAAEREGVVDSSSRSTCELRPYVNIELVEAVKA